MADPWSGLHPLYQQLWWQWRFTELSYLGGAAYLTPDIPIAWAHKVPSTDDAGRPSLVSQRAALQSFLWRHDREETADYQQRVLSSYYRNFLRPVVDVRSAHVLSQPVVRTDDGAPVLQAVWDDADRSGRGMTAWMADGLAAAQEFGHVWCVVDMPRAPVAEVTLADAADYRARPYGCWVSPLRVADWEADADGLVWVKIAEAPQHVRQSADEPCSEARILWRIWYRDHWELREGPPSATVYSAAIGHTAGTGTLLESGTHPVGRVPVEVMYYRRLPGEQYVGYTDCYDIAEVCREVYNLDSQRQDMLRNQCFAFCCVPDTDGRVTALEVGIRRAFAYNPATGGAPQFVGPPTDYVTLNREETADLVLQIRAMAGLSRGVGEQSIAARSGDALLVETADKSAILGALASQAQDFEQRFAKLAAAWVGQKWSGMVRYPETYSQRQLMDDIDEALKLKELGLPAEAMAAVYERVIRQAFATMAPAELAALVASVRAEKPAMPSSAPMVVEYRGKDENEGEAEDANRSE